VEANHINPMRRFLPFRGKKTETTTLEDRDVARGGLRCSDFQNTDSHFEVNGQEEEPGAGPFGVKLLAEGNEPVVEYVTSLKSLRTTLKSEALRFHLSLRIDRRASNRLASHLSHIFNAIPP
jgi:hypothetical protein